jgi:hypothetical protein
MGIVEAVIIRVMSRRSLILTGLVFALPIAIIAVPPRHDRGWIDPVTGSMKTESGVLFITISSDVQQSALERWIIAHEGQYKNQWQFLHDTSQSALATTFACGSTPEIYRLNAGDELNEGFVRSATDATIAEFVRVMRDGAPEDHKQAVDAACKIAFDAISKD